MNLLVDTSVWSLALRRDAPPDQREVAALSDALTGSDVVATTGLILLELLRGLVPGAVRERIIEQFAALDLIEPTTAEYVSAAELANRCRAAGVRVGTIDALIAALAIERDLVLLTTDRDFEHIARVEPLRVWVGLGRAGDSLGR